jgi:hypothetical protein
MSYNVDNKLTLQNCFSLGYKLLYVERLRLRKPTVAVTDVDVGRERDRPDCSSASIAVVCYIPMA